MCPTCIGRFVATRVARIFRNVKESAASIDFYQRENSAIPSRELTETGTRMYIEDFFLPRVTLAAEQSR